MKKTTVLLLICLFNCFLADSCLSEESSGKTYQDLFIARVERTKLCLEQTEPNKFFSDDPRKNPTAMITQAINAYRVGKATNNDQYIQLGIKLFDDFLAMNPAMGRGSDFHYTRPWGLMVFYLNRDGYLTGTRREQTRATAAAYLLRFWEIYGNDKAFTSDTWDHNIHQAEITAASLSARVFTDLELSPSVIELTDKYINRVLQTGDFNENASNYSPLGIVYFFDHLKALGRLDEIQKNPNFKNLIARWRDFISPAGFMPEIGDSYFFFNAYPMDIVLVLETGARAFNDPSFATEAARINQLRKTASGDDMLFRAWGLVELTPYSFTDTKNEQKAIINKRALYGEKQMVYDKLVLRTGNKPGDAMILMDLYSLGSHCHEFRRSAVNYYENSGVPLFHELGRRGTTSADNGNVFWVSEQNYSQEKSPKVTETFPSQVLENQWNTMIIPVNRLNPTDNPKEFKFGRSFDFRTFGQRKMKYVQFDNLRLEGNKGVLLIDDFSSPDLWRNKTKGNDWKTVPDSTIGNSSQQVPWGTFGTSGPNRMLPPQFRDFTVNTDDYQYVKFDYKFSGPQPYASIRGSAFNWIDMCAQPLNCTVDSARIISSGTDSDKSGDLMAEVVFSDYKEQGNKLTRRIVLTDDGVVIIIDDFVRAMDCPSTAGQLWQLYSLEDSGKNWFVSESDGDFSVGNTHAAPLKSLVVFDSDNCGFVRKNPQFMHAIKMKNGRPQTRHEFFTVYSKQEMESKQISCVMAVIPLPEKADGKQIAATVHFNRVDNQTVEISYSNNGKTITKKISPCGIER